MVFKDALPQLGTNPAVLRSTKKPRKDAEQRAKAHSTAHGLCHSLLAKRRDVDVQPQQIDVSLLTA